MDPTPARLLVNPSAALSRKIDRALQQLTGRYDVNNNESIKLGEVNAAIADYFLGRLTLEEASVVIGLSTGQ